MGVKNIPLSYLRHKKHKYDSTSHTRGIFVKRFYLRYIKNKERLPSDYISNEKYILQPHFLSSLDVFILLHTEGLFKQENDAIICDSLSLREAPSRKKSIGTQDRESNQTVDVFPLLPFVRYH